MAFLIILVILLAGWFISVGHLAYCNIQLMEQAHQGNEYRVRELLRGRADINSQDQQGLTPLMVAAAQGHFSIVKLLLEAGANPHITDFKGYGAEHHAVYYGHIEIGRLIVEYKLRSDSTIKNFK